MQAQVYGAKDPACISTMGWGPSRTTLAVKRAPTLFREAGTTGTTTGSKTTLFLTFPLHPKTLRSSRIPRKRTASVQHDTLQEPRPDCNGSPRLGLTLQMPG